MDRSATEIKVGIFVLLAIAVSAAMIIKFGKGTRVAQGDYEITAKFTEVGGIIPGASVYYQGVHVGKVAEITLDETANKVAIVVAVSKSARIPANSRFEIRQVGFLGDKVINIAPVLPPSKEILKPGAVVEGVVPFDIGNLGEKAGEMVSKIGGFVENLDTLIKRLNTEMLDPSTMANTRTTIANAATASAETAAAIRELKDLLKSNRAAVDAALANFASLSADMERTATRVDTLVANNAPKIDASVVNFQQTTVNIRELSGRLQDTADRIDSIVARVEQGEGAMGLLITDPEAKENLRKTLQELSAFSANVRKRGILWYKDLSQTKPAEKQKEDKPAAPGNRGIIYQKPGTETPP